MWERGCFPTTILAQLRRPCRPRHPYAVPRTSLQCVCTRRRNCIEQLSPFSEYVPAAPGIKPDSAALFKGAHYPVSCRLARMIGDGYLRKPEKQPNDVQPI